MTRYREYIELDNDSDSEPALSDNDSGGESEEEDIGGCIPEPSKDAGIDEYQKLLKAAQLSLSNVKLELAKVKKQIPADNQATKTKRRTKDIPEEITKNDKAIKDYGRQYAIVISPWVDLSFFGHAERPDVDPLHPDRYKTKSSQQSANIAELFDFIPKALHPLMEKHSRFGDLFRSHVSAMRSTAIHGVREQGYLIFGLDGTWIASGLDRSTIPELQKLIKRNGAYDTFPRILFPNDAMKMKDIFRNEALPKILRMIFFGPSSLRPNNVPRPKTNAEIWKVSAVTAGSIALSAILARFILSPDVEFSPKGATTGINYLEDFHLYKRTLLSDSPRMKELFEWYNKRIFARNDTPNKKTVASGNNESTYDDLIRALNEESDDATEEEVLPDENPAGSNPQGQSATDSSEHAPPGASASTGPSAPTAPAANTPTGSESSESASKESAAPTTTDETPDAENPLEDEVPTKKTASKGRTIKVRGGSAAARKTRSAAQETI